MIFLLRGSCSFLICLGGNDYVKIDFFHMKIRFRIPYSRENKGGLIQNSRDFRTRLFSKRRQAWGKNLFYTILATSVAYKCSLKIFSCFKWLWLRNYFSIDKCFWKKTSWFFKVSTYLISHKWDNIFEITLKSRKINV